MKLIFKKDKDHQISVFQVIDGKEKEFSYVDMIKTLIESKKMDIPDISEGFTDAEIRSIGSMVQFINRQISAIEASDTKT